MAEYVFTAADVNAGTLAGTVAFPGEGIEVGQLIFMDATNANKVALAYCNDEEVFSKVVGIALATGNEGQNTTYLKSGEVTVDDDMFEEAGRVLVLSHSTPGAIMDIGDLAEDDWIVIVGWSTGTNKFLLDITLTGIQYAVPAP